MKLESMIKGNTYIKNIVAPLKRIPVTVAIIDGKSNTGMDFLIPYVKVVKTINKFTALPTSNCGFPISKGIKIDREYIEKRTIYSNLILSSFCLYIFCNSICIY